MATVRTWKLTGIVIFVISSPTLSFVWNRLKSYFPAFAISGGSFGNGLYGVELWEGKLISAIVRQLFILRGVDGIVHS